MSIESEIRALIVEETGEILALHTGALLELESRVSALEDEPIPEPTSSRGPRSAPPVPTGPNVRFVPSSVDDSGATDVTDQLNAILDDLDAGDILVFAQGDSFGFRHGIDSPISEYRITDRLEVRVPNDVTLWGYGTRIRQYGTGTSSVAKPTFVHLRNDIQDLTYAGFDLYGSNGQWSRTTDIYDAQGEFVQGDSGIRFNRPHQRTTIEDCWIHHMNGDGIQQSGGSSRDWRTVYDTVVRYCTVEDNKRQNINFNVGYGDQNPYGWHVHHCIVGNAGLFNMDAEDVSGFTGGRPSLSLLIEDNEFQETGWWWATKKWAQKHIATNWGSSGGMQPPRFANLGPFVIRRNLITGYSAIAARDPSGGDWYDRCGFWVKSYYGSGPNSGNWTDYDRIQGVYIEDNIVDVPPYERTSDHVFVRARAVDTLVVDGNQLQSGSVDAPTTGYGSNTDVRGSDV